MPGSREVGNNQATMPALEMCMPAARTHTSDTRLAAAGRHAVTELKTKNRSSMAGQGSPLGTAAAVRCSRCAHAGAAACAAAGCAAPAAGTACRACARTAGDELVPPRGRPGRRRLLARAAGLLAADLLPAAGGSVRPGGGQSELEAVPAGQHYIGLHEENMGWGLRRGKGCWEAAEASAWAALPAARCPSDLTSPSRWEPLEQGHHATLAWSKAVLRGTGGGVAAGACGLAACSAPQLGASRRLWRQHRAQSAERRAKAF